MHVDDNYEQRMHLELCAPLPLLYMPHAPLCFMTFLYAYCIPTEIILIQRHQYNQPLNFAASLYDLVGVAGKTK